MKPLGNQKRNFKLLVLISDPTTLHLVVEHAEGSEYKALQFLLPQQVNGVLSNVDYTTAGPVLVAHLLQ